MNNKLLLTFGSFLFSLIMMLFVVFAWFTLSSKVDSSPFESSVIDLDAHYDLYVYIDQEHMGDQTRILHENIYQEGDIDDYYILAEDSADTYLFGGSSISLVYPGNVFSFVIQVTNFSTTNGLIDISFSQPVSYPVETPDVEKIQNAFYYQVTKMIYYYGGSEVTEITPSGTYQTNISYFNVNASDFLVAENAPVDSNSFVTSCLLIYFDIGFDPNIVDPISGDSNLFQNQQFFIDSIHIDIKKAD